MPLKFAASREDLLALYKECLERNPLLGRIEGECRLIGWTDEEIRTFQLLTAVESNASLQAHVGDLERRVAVFDDSLVKERH